MTKTFAEKPLTKVVLLFYVVLTIFCAASCSAGASGKLKQIPSDVDYDFVIFNRDNLVINGVHYDINELARKISGKKNRNYIKFSVLIGDFLYYSYEYGSRHGIFGNGDDNYGYNRGRIIIKNENDETLYEIDGEYAAANNPKYSGLFNAYRENCDGTGAYVGAETYKNRLFISFSYDFGLYGGHTADMIFEFNPENGNLSYVTYIYGGCRFFSITEKSDSDNLGDLGNPDNPGETPPAQSGD